MLPFKVDQGKVREQIRRWFGSKWLAPNNLKRRALVDRVHGVYIPYWTFDAHVVCPWEAEAGHYYYTTETYRDNQGRSQRRQKRQVRWEPASGEVRHFFDDEPVPGTHGVRHDLLRQVEPFATSELVGYDKAYVSGFVVEHYQVVLLEAAERSLQRDAREADGALRRAGTGGHASQPADPSDVFRADVQARPGADLASLVHVRHEDLTRWS